MIRSIDNDETMAAALEASASQPVKIEKPKRKSCGCGKNAATQTKREPQRFEWDENLFRKVNTFLLTCQKFGIVRTLSAWFVNELRRVLRFVWRAWTFTRTVLSGWCSRSTYMQRMGACYGCELYTVIAKRGYCGGCGCIKGKWWWPFSRLVIKNKFRRNSCPKGLHER